MNVKELIEEWKKYPQDIRVIVNGYEGGYDDVESINKIKLLLNQNEEWYYGKHESVEKEEDKVNAVDALLLT